MSGKLRLTLRIALRMWQKMTRAIEQSKTSVAPISGQSPQVAETIDSDNPVTVSDVISISSSELSTPKGDPRNAFRRYLRTQ
jgi:hypothetical protein